MTPVHTRAARRCAFSKNKLSLLEQLSKIIAAIVVVVVVFVVVVVVDVISNDFLVHQHRHSVCCKSYNIRVVRCKMCDDSEHVYCNPIEIYIFSRSRCI